MIIKDYYFSNTFLTLNQILHLFHYGNPKQKRNSTNCIHSIYIHSSYIDFKDLMKIYQKCTAEKYSLNALKPKELEAVKSEDSKQPLKYK